MKVVVRNRTNQSEHSWEKENMHCPERNPEVVLGQLLPENPLRM